MCVNLFADYSLFGLVFFPRHTYNRDRKFVGPYTKEAPQNSVNDIGAMGITYSCCYDSIEIGFLHCDGKMDIFFDPKNCFCLIENILNELHLLYRCFLWIPMSSCWKQYSTVSSTSDRKVFSYLSFLLRSLNNLEFKFVLLRLHDRVWRHLPPLGGYLVDQPMFCHLPNFLNTKFSRGIVGRRRSGSWAPDQASCNC